MIAEDIRRIMANLGIAKFQDMIGRTDLLKRFDNTFHRLGTRSETKENVKLKERNNQSDYLILDRWLDDLISHEEDDKFFSRTPILLFSFLTRAAIKLFQVTDISDK